MDDGQPVPMHRLLQDYRVDTGGRPREARAMISFTYVEPRDVGEVLETLARHGDDAKLIAGGTGLINLMKQNLVQPAYLVGLRRVGGVDIIKSASGLEIGALCTLRKIESTIAVDSGFSLLAETCRQVATIRIRSMATIGGALAHADPYQDTPPALMVLDAMVRLHSKKGTREAPVSDLFTGYYETVIQPDELVTEGLIPPQPSGSGSVFIKFLPQTHDDYATVAVAARVTLQNERISDARVALGAAPSTPLRRKVVEDALRGHAPTPDVLREAAALVASVVDPIPDFRGSANYKRDMAVVFVARARPATGIAGRRGGARPSRIHTQTPP